jgi:hypothetical protein
MSEAEVTQRTQFKTLRDGLTMSAVAAVITLALPAQASLVSRLDGAAVYDTDLDVTWLADADLIFSNSFGLFYNRNLGSDANGVPSTIYNGGDATWGGAQKWIAAMNAAHYLGYSDWALPTTTQGCRGYGCIDSQLGHLFYEELGGVAGQSIATTHNANYGLFKNLLPLPYWTGTEYTADAGIAWLFNPNYGTQALNFKDYNYFVMAVRPGDVFAVPEVDTRALLLAGLGLSGWLARRRRGWHRPT